MKPKNETVRRQIIDAATDLIIETGIAGTSTVKVAKRINGAQSNIYSYFKSKEALIAGVFDYHQKLITATLAPALEDATSPKALITSVASALFEFATTHPTSIQIIAAFRAQPSLRHQLPAIDENDVFTKLFGLFRRYQQDGLIKPIPAEFLAEATFSIIVDYCNAKLAGEAYTSALDETTVAQLIADLVLLRA
ncbi:TetR/AcrR family transcriptional regulator [Lacticaseibacillus saniviri]|uniref:HTH tetR-type domain-containing protein n=1 Tax=Lacticaseibacillus saniviri JCM 17471 = DSM 24301 TaxID=1293598 RepID=A0A0R2MUF7_9LACO|nr:TetR/AcrR family transcriptional regulator [Lacticaseibacillus saniviri]KRO15936.1 hypothetical protein IV56_GL002127 [Lacticaseibacillus saniviri JCM 17471 = DSM 24301]MCG4282682.1 TetR/AcrR family transcriptional regulator [Lacticaseibacillus saniviri]